jgi:hypothetical protein
MKPHITPIVSFLVISLAGFAGGESAPPPHVIADFEAGSWGDWTVEGTAFGAAPAKGPWANQRLEGFHGSGFANSYGPGGDGAMGRLTSPSFEITQKYLTFLLGGGKDPQGGTTLGIRLEVDGQVVRKATGTDSDAMHLRVWDMANLLGKTGRIILEDGSAGPWGHLVADRIALVSSLDFLLEPRADGTVDLQGFIQTHLDVGAKNIVVPPGRYRVAPRGRVHLRLEKLENVEVVMKGVEMVCTETTQAVSISGCKNSKLSGLTIDYDPLPFTQGRITALGPENEWIEFELLKGYPENQLERRIEIFDAKTGELKTGTRFDWEPFEKIGDRKYRVRQGPGYKFNPAAVSEEVGDFLVTNNNFAPGGQIPHTIVSSGNTEMVLEDVTVFGSNCFSFLEYFCDKTTYLRCRLDRRSPADDPVKRGWMRLRSGNADAFHSKHALRGPQIIGCTAKWMGDDAVNICGEYYMIMGSKGDTVQILSGKNINLAVGDPVELVSYTGERIPDAKVTAIAADGVVNEEEIAFLQAQRMNKGTQNGLSQPTTKAHAITLDREVALPMGSVIASMNHMGNGFLVKDCDFGMNRSRGILIKASQGGVINNRLHGSWGSALLVTPEWWWLESGSSDDLVISGNRISDCRDVSIRIHAQGGNGKSAPAGAHNRIHVRDNTIATGRLPAVHVSSVKEGSITGNTLTLTTAGEAISLGNNENVDIRDNTITPPAP